MRDGHFLKSFGNALRGVAVAFAERNFRLQMSAALIVVALMFFFNVTLVEKSILVLLVIIVLVLEILNSILERLIDVLKPRLHLYVKDIKDMAAAAVLVASLGAAAVGIIIFYPHVRGLILRIGGAE